MTIFPPDAPWLSVETVKVDDDTLGLSSGNGDGAPDAGETLELTVLLRNVVERRGELAMLLALGFTRGRLVGVVLLENALLLLIGVAVGTFCALVAAGPQLASATSDVNWTSLASMLLLTAGVGVASCALASAASVRGELIAALRSE